MGCLRGSRATRFQSTLSLRRATRRVYPKLASCCRFQSTLSLRRATTSLFSLPTRFRYFNPRSPCGERPGIRRPLRPDQARFQSTLSLRRATVSLVGNYIPTGQFQSTLSLRRATSDAAAALTGRSISIHALLAESDRLGVTASIGLFDISIHALLAESDAVAPLGTAAVAAYFNPRSPCGERHSQITCRYSLAGISIHALLAESD